MVGGKINIGEHVREAAIREVMEETCSPKVDDYVYRGIVSERLVDADGILLTQFLIFVGYATINEYTQTHREGNLALFSLDEIQEKKDQFLPSDYEMFQRFMNKIGKPLLHEVELLHDDKGYHLVYYREQDNASQ